MGKVTDRWRNFMKGQIKRARMFYDEAERGIFELNQASRWPVNFCVFIFALVVFLLLESASGMTKTPNCSN